MCKPELENDYSQRCQLDFSAIWREQIRLRNFHPFGQADLRFYLGPLLTAAGLTDTTTQLVLNISLNAWFFVTGLLGTVIIDKVRRRSLFSISQIRVCLTRRRQQYLHDSTPRSCWSPYQASVPSSRY